MRKGVSRAAVYYLLEGPGPPDTRGTVTILATIPEASKVGPVEGEFTVYRTGDLTDPLTVYYAVTGTAVPDVDYEPLTGFVVIPAGESSAPIPVIPIPEEPVPEEPIIEFSVTAMIASKVGPIEGEFTVTRTGPTDDPLVVPYSISGTAVPGVDYVELPGEITIPAGESSAVIPVVPIP